MVAVIQVLSQLLQINNASSFTPLYVRVTITIIILHLCDVEVTSADLFTLCTGSLYFIHDSYVVSIYNSCFFYINCSLYRNILRCVYVESDETCFSL